MRRVLPGFARTWISEASKDWIDTCFALSWSDTKALCYEELGVTYRGTWSVTESGLECANWNSSALAQKRYNGRRVDALQLGLGNHNYCR